MLLIWTAGMVAVWLSADAFLNPGVTEESIQECLEEGFFPARECEQRLEELEAAEDPVLAVGSAVVIWIAGCLLIFLVVGTHGRSREITNANVSD
ncbi:MAG TPA: hypothetical protein VHH55_05625 [Gaiellaceae bacterium]|nr:hypothetical protein [Gaiellaceae bacterium]